MLYLKTVHHFWIAFGIEFAITQCFSLSKFRRRKKRLLCIKIILTIIDVHNYHQRQKYSPQIHHDRSSTYISFHRNVKSDFRQVCWLNHPAIWHPLERATLPYNPVEITDSRQQERNGETTRETRRSSRWIYGPSVSVVRGLLSEDNELALWALPTFPHRWWTIEYYEAVTLVVFIHRLCVLYIAYTDSVCTAYTTGKVESQRWLSDENIVINSTQLSYCCMYTEHGVSSVCTIDR